MTTDGVTLTKRSDPEASPVLLEVSGDRDIAAACPEEGPANTGMTRASPPRQTATVENVVPRSTPIKVSVVITERSDPKSRASATGSTESRNNTIRGNEDGKLDAFDAMGGEEGGAMVANDRGIIQSISQKRIDERKIWNRNKL